MTILKVTVEDEQADVLKGMLKHIDIVKSVEEEHSVEKSLQEPLTAYERLKSIQERIGDKKLFTEIEDPSEWQRKIRKEWERDF